MMTLRKVYNYVVVKYIYSKAYSPIELIYIYIATIVQFRTQCVNVYFFDDC